MKQSIIHGRNCRYSVYRVVKNHHPLLSQELMCISDSYNRGAHSPPPKKPGRSRGLTPSLPPGWGGSINHV